MKAGFWEILLIVILVLILFGHSKIPDLMKNLANGINVFKKELKKDDKSGGQNDKETKGQMDSEPVKKAIVKKPAVKKSAARKTAVKKPAVKKSLVKKSVAKKPTAKKK